MKIIKLDATDSTNSFLKELAQNSALEDYTTVITNNQTSGRGQMNNTWLSEQDKNLTFSVFTKLTNLLVEDQAYLNFAVSIALFRVLNSLSVPNLSIKWPNDIMSGSHKICGLLIETTFKKMQIKNTIIGIGLNVNQKEFPSQLSNASSLINVCNKQFDLDELLTKLLNEIKIQIIRIENNELDNIHKEYQLSLFKKDIPTAFKNERNHLLFMGMIKGVSTKGNLQIQLEDDSIVEYGIKEISLAKA